MSSTKGLLAYAAGTSVVAYNAQKKEVEFQVGFPSGNSIACLAFSPDGKYLCAAQCSTTETVATLDFHKFGINCLAFSPNSKLIVRYHSNFDSFFSVGSPHDGCLSVWDWKANRVVGAAKLEKRPIHAVAFNADGKTFVTAGDCHAQFWTTEARGTTIRCGLKNEPTPLIDGVSAIDPEEEAKGGMQVYRDICFGTGSNSNLAFGLTDKGRLVAFQNRRVDRYLDVKSKCGLALAASDSVIALGCVEGVVRLFNPATLEYYQSVPRPAKTAEGTYPDAVGCQMVQSGAVLLVLFSDNSLYHYKIENPKSPSPDFCVAANQWSLAVEEDEEEELAPVQPTAAAPKAADETFDIDDIFADLDDEPVVTGKWAERAEADGTHKDTFNSFAGGADNRRFTIEPQQLQQIQMAVAGPSPAEIEARIRKELEAKMAEELRKEREQLNWERQRVEESRRELAEQQRAAQKAAAEVRPGTEAPVAEVAVVPFESAVETPRYVAPGDLDEEIEEARARIMELGGCPPELDELPEPQPASLEGAFRKTMAVYETLKEEHADSVGKFETAFQSILNRMPQSANTAKAEPSAPTLNPENLEPLLAKYSDLLLQAVTGKLQANNKI